MPVQWKDETSYSRNGPREQTVWTARFGDLSLTVLTGHIYARDRWVMHFRPFYDTHELGATKDEMTPLQAQEMALQLARAKLAPIFKALDSVANVT